MIIRLQRPLFIGDLRFPKGEVTIPDFIDRKQVVTYDKKGEPGKCWVLPKDAQVLSEMPEFVAEMDEPTTLSEIAKGAAKPAGFAEAMKSLKK